MYICPSATRRKLMTHADGPMHPTETPPSASSPSIFKNRVFIFGAIAGFVAGLVVVGGVAGVISLAAAVGEASRSAALEDQAAEAEAAIKEVFPDALKKCGLKDDDDSSIGDGGYSLTVDNKGDDDFSGIT